jgi:phosphoribosylanthranilate isomerase
MFVKICGITNLEDALLSVECGADAVGLIFADSPRRIDPLRARKIAMHMKGRARLVGVFCDMNPDAVREISDLCMLDLLQFHGNESSGYCSMFSGRAIKAVRFKSREDLRDISSYVVEFVLVDSAISGETCDWSILKEYRLDDKKLILAGGLNPDNVAAAIEQVMPFGVDSSSGVEACVGKKDPMKVREFITRAKAAAQLAREEKFT